MTVATVLTLVARVRAALSAIAWARALLIGVSVSGAAWVMTQLVLQRELAMSVRSMELAGAFAVVVAAVVRARVGRINPTRAALWMEERQSAGFALVTLVEQVTARARSTDGARAADTAATTSRLMRALDSGAAAGRVPITIVGDALARSAFRQLGGPALFAVGLAVVAAGGSRVWSNADIGGRTVSDDAIPGARDATIGPWRVRVVPPDYTGRTATDYGDAASVSALSGSRLDMVGGGATLPEIRIRSLVQSDTASAVVSSTADVQGVADGWQAFTTTTAQPTELRAMRGSASRLLLVDGYADSLPRVELRLPVRDSVLRRATGVLPLEALVHDDIGLASATFELIVSTGEGEQFTARTVRVAATRFSRTHDTVLRASLHLDSMSLGPGDIMHMRAIARDGHPSVTREAGVSETRSFRVARASEYDSVAVEAAPPPEFDKSLLSQRMLLLLTEKLESRRLRISRPVLLSESGTLARDQGRLRLAVGDIVFQRLGGESDATAVHGADASGPPTGKADLGMLEEGDDSPVISINRPLLEAYNAMWDAGRALEQGDTKGAIPHMRIALAAIERSRAASRLYLRGKPPTVIVDVARVRLVGRDTGTTNARTPRTRLSAVSAVRESRLLAAAATAGVDPASTRDSLAVLRLESVADAPDFARALAGVLAHLARGGDLTDDFARARRTLGGLARVPNGDWSRVAPP